MERGSPIKEGIDIELVDTRPSILNMTSPTGSAPTSPVLNGVHKSFIQAVDFVEFWVGNAKVASKYYCTTWGFSPLTFKAIDSGEKQRFSHVISQKDIVFVFTSARTGGDTEFNKFLTLHGDAVKDVGLRVSNVYQAFSHAVSNGAKVIEEPHEITDEEDGTIVLARIASPYGDFIHTLVDRSNYTGTTFMPLYHKNTTTLNGPPTPTRSLDGFSHHGLLTHIDHVTLAYEQGHMYKAMDWYSKCFGFQQFLCNDEDTQEGLTVIGQESGLKTLVITTSLEKYSFKFVLVEGLADKNGKIKNQIQEFLEYNGGPGIQHLALHTKDMITTVDTLRNKGVEFIDVPATYYDALFENEASFMKDSYKTLKDLGILLDISYKNQATGNKQPSFLMQTFTLPMQDRPTFFMEIISRKGSSGFGRKTIKALFEAVERLQQQRTLYTSEL